MNVDAFIAILNQEFANIASFSDPQLAAYRDTLAQQLDEIKVKLAAVDQEIACRAAHA